MTAVAGFRFPDAIGERPFPKWTGRSNGKVSPTPLGRQAVFVSPVGPPQSGQRASDENRPTLARSGAPFWAPELGLRHSKVRRRRLQSPEQRHGANATGATLAVGAAARLLNARSAARGTDATGRNINRCLREDLSIPSLESDALCGLPTASFPRTEGPLPDPFCANIRQVSDIGT